MFSTKSKPAACEPVMQTLVFEVCGLTGRPADGAAFWGRVSAALPASFRSVLFRHGAPTQAAQISTAWRWSSVNEYSGMSAAQPMRRCRLTIDRVSLPIDPNARI